MKSSELVGAFFHLSESLFGFKVLDVGINDDETVCNDSLIYVVFLISVCKMDSFLFFELWKIIQ